MGSVVISQAVSDRLHCPHTMLGGSVSQTATSDSAFHTSHPPYPPPQVERSSSNNTSSSSTTTPPYPHRNAPTASTVPPPAATHNPLSTSSMTPNQPHSPHHNSSHSQHQQHEAGTDLPLMNNIPNRSTVNSTPASPGVQSNHQSAQSKGRSATTSPNRIKVRDLSHIQSFASEEILGQSQGSRNSGSQDGGRQYEISSMPVQDIIEMVAGLLTKITTTNDLQHEHIHRHIPPPEGTAGLSAQTTSVLAFHGKNVPSITILSYLSRIHKYCPTTYEVFLSLLVYFDRMTEMVNKGTLQSLQKRPDPTADPVQPPSTSSSSSQPNAHPPVVTPPSSARMDAQDTHSPPSTVPPSLSLTEEEENLSHFFVVDSFNIHRLVIAGVTCASKFFSDVFYTNSRYAKVAYHVPLYPLYNSLTSDPGRRSPSCRTEPSRAPIPSTQRLPSLRPGRRT